MISSSLRNSNDPRTRAHRDDSTIRAVSIAIPHLRYYRHKYDAHKTIAALSASLRQEVNLEDLQDQLMTVVEETIQPILVSLWMVDPDMKMGEKQSGDKLP